MNTYSSGLPLNKGLRDIAFGLSTLKIAPPKEKPWRCKFTKEQVLDMRVKHQFEGWHSKRIQEHFNMTRDEAYRYLNYTVQTFLVPKRPVTSVA